MTFNRYIFRFLQRSFRGICSFVLFGHHPAPDVAGSLRSGAHCRSASISLRYIESGSPARQFSKSREILFCTIEILSLLRRFSCGIATHYASLMQKITRSYRPLSLNFTFLLSLFVCLISGPIWGQENQVAIPRIDLMPNEPAPMNIRDWRQVASDYDQFVFDKNKTGDYLPLIYINGQGVNYPDQKNFGLHTYVGTFSPLGNEAINVLPTLVGSTLVGIDKSDQDGENYILMSQDFFNKNNGELIYLNNLSGASGNDWWYDLMPNVFFYQLYDLYPDIGGEAELQFVSVADRFTQSVRAMGGGETPWAPAFMDYRGWNFREMTPNPGGVRQPEAAGAYAWVLYHAHRRTGNTEYLKAAEWSMEFLSDWPNNPSYELQLPYGTYTAARMNAELGTDYDVEKMLNWSFDRGALRGWGTIVGKWGGLDVSGLVGEANDNGNDYAFQLNGVQHAAALVPMVRYDKRFARAMGKWMLNLANATRLFYPGFLPAFLQDASDWSEVYDPQRVVGYEALRERWEGLSPFSTGDALRGNWAATNLALYGSSSIGYLGAMLQPTSDPKILQIDLLKTDFFKESSYPTYMYFNPYTTNKNIILNVGMETVDIYEVLSETFIANSVSGEVNIDIPADEAVILVMVPSGSELRFEKNKLLANEVIIDYQQTVQPFTWAPRIQALAALADEVQIADSTKVYLTFFDQDSENFEVTWSISGGELTGEGNVRSWIAPEEIGEYEIKVTVEDESGNIDSLSITINSLAEINQPPVIERLVADRKFIAPGQIMTIRCIATDPNGDALTYTWNANAGEINGAGSLIEWTAPQSNEIVSISCTVDDGRGLSTEARIEILVKDLEGVSNAELIAHYPFSGNAMDISGNELHGNVSGAFLTDDQLGRSGQAYRFNGSTHHISVPVKPVLNVQDGISLVCVFKALNLPEKELFLVSHGSWQNRWKLSITPERLLRWTINSSLGPIRDLDGSTPLEQDVYYHVVVTYDGEVMALYVDGNLQTFVQMSGPIRTSQVPLLMAQMLPGEQEFNFNGVMDEVRIYGAAIYPAEAKELYEGSLVSSLNEAGAVGLKFEVFPNPAKDVITIRFEDALVRQAGIVLMDVNGKIYNKAILEAGVDQKNISIATLPEGIYLIRLESNGKMIGSQVFIKN